MPCHVQPDELIFEVYCGSLCRANKNGEGDGGSVPGVGGVSVGVVVSVAVLVGKDVVVIVADGTGLGVVVSEGTTVGEMDGVMVGVNVGVNVAGKGVGVIEGVSVIVAVGKPKGVGKSATISASGSGLLPSKSTSKVMIQATTANTLNMMDAML